MSKHVHEDKKSKKVIFPTSEAHMDILVMCHKSTTTALFIFSCSNSLIELLPSLHIVLNCTFTKKTVINSFRPSQCFRRRVDGRQPQSEALCRDQLIASFTGADAALERPDAMTDRRVFGAEKFRVFGERARGIPSERQSKHVVARVVIFAAARRRTAELSPSPHHVSTALVMGNNRYCCGFGSVWVLCKQRKSLFGSGSGPILFALSSIRLYAVWRF